MGGEGEGGELERPVDMIAKVRESVSGPGKKNGGIGLSQERMMS